jgi:hypothetical protein
VYLSRKHVTWNSKIEGRAFQGKHIEVPTACEEASLLDGKSKPRASAASAAALSTSWVMRNNVDCNWSKKRVT